MTDHERGALRVDTTPATAAAGDASERRGMPTRRKVLLGGVSVVAVAGLGIGALLLGGEDAALAGLSRADAEPLGDGFYRVDGWILTEADLASLPS